MMKNARIAIGIALLLCPLLAQAASVRLLPEPARVGIGDTLSVSVVVDSAVPVNALSGALRYPAQKLALVGLSDGNSVVSLWVERPADAGGSVPFAGLVPGGYAGSGGLLFTATFKVLAAGDVSLSLEHPAFLHNDGSGSAESVGSSTLELSLDSVAHGGATSTPDSAPPEPFAIVLGKGDILDGKTYAAFTTTDKGSGVAYFEAAERRVPLMPLRWERAASPYVLHDQYGTSDLYVRAVDAAGNARTEEYPRSSVVRRYEWVLVLCIALLAGIVFYYHAKRT